MAEFDRIVADPRLSRATVEQHSQSDSAGLLLLDEYHRVVATGGSSGQRGVFVYDQAGWELAFANARRFQGMLGMPPDARAVGIGAPSPVHLTYRVNAEQRVGRPDAPRLSVITPITEVVSALNAYQPELISTYPSFIRQLARLGGCGFHRERCDRLRRCCPPDVKDLVWNTRKIQSPQRRSDRGWIKEWNAGNCSAFTSRRTLLSWRYRRGKPTGTTRRSGREGVGYDHV